MALARQMYANGDGWSIKEIRAYLAERGHDVVWETVKAWADPAWAERRRLAHRAARRRWWRERHRARTFRVLDEHAREQVRATPDLLLALRLEDGLSYAAIAKIINRFTGLDLTATQVRRQLHQLGVAKHPRNPALATAPGQRRAAG
jgi:transposase